MLHQSMTLQARPSFDQFAGFMCCPVDASRNVPQLLSNKNKVVKKDIWTGILSHETQTLSTHHLLWFRCFATCNGRLHVVRMELLRKMPRQNIRLDRVLSDSVQHCIDLSPIDNCDFGWTPNFIESRSSLVQMFYGLQRKITCCSDGTLAHDASPEH
jgi:hypothetical protein